MMLRSQDSHDSVSMLQSSMLLVMRAGSYRILCEYAGTHEYCSVAVIVLKGEKKKMAFCNSFLSIFE